MARPRLPIVDRLSPDEVARRHRAGRHPVEETRWQPLWLMTRPDRPRPADEAARLVGFTGNGARALVKRYNAHGPDGRADRRATNGQKPKLSADQRPGCSRPSSSPRPAVGCGAGRSRAGTSATATAWRRATRPPGIISRRWASA